MRYTKLHLVLSYGTGVGAGLTVTGLMLEGVVAANIASSLGLVFIWAGLWSSMRRRARWKEIKKAAKERSSNPDLYLFTPDEITEIAIIKGGDFAQSLRKVSR